MADGEYMSVMDKGLAHIQVSITSTDSRLSKRIEPGAPTPDNRIMAVETLQENGFDVAVRLSPLIPEIIDFVLDRPFMFVITGADGSILFSGVVRNIE